MKTYSFPIQFAQRLNVPDEFPKFLKVVAPDIRTAANLMEKAVARHYSVTNPNRYMMGFYTKDEAAHQAYLEEKGIIVEDGDTTEYKGRKFGKVRDQGYLSDLEVDPDSAIKYIRESRKEILRQFPSATDFCIAAHSEDDSSCVEFKMEFMRQETQAEADLRNMVEFFEGAARKREKYAQLEALKRELGEG